MRLLDTDTCIEILRGNDAVIERRAAILDTVGTTWINACELHFGASKSSRPTENAHLVSTFLSSLPVLGLDEGAARIFGEAKTRLQREGQSLADADLLIGAIAAAHGAIVVTGNRAHFERFPALRIEDWIRG